MIAFIEMLVGPAGNAGIKVPPDIHNFNSQEYTHFYVYAKVQLGSPMPSPTSYGTNAKIIAAIPEDKIKLITFEELLDLGLEIGFPIP